MEIPAYQVYKPPEKIVTVTSKGTSLGGGFFLTNVKNSYMQYTSQNLESRRRKSNRSVWQLRGVIGTRPPAGESANPSVRQLQPVKSSSLRGIILIFFGQPMGIPKDHKIYKLLKRIFWGYSKNRVDLFVILFCKGISSEKFKNYFMDIGKINR